jgi:hypothetical protein
MNPSNSNSYQVLPVLDIGTGVAESPQPTSDSNVAVVMPKKQAVNEIGQSGTLVFAGFISGEEYNSDLIGNSGLAVWDEMRKSDAGVAGTLKLMKLPIKAAHWYMEPASDSEQDQKIARFVENAIFHRIKWQSTLHELLTYLEFGFYVGEKCFAVDTFEGQMVITLEKISFRKQKSILKWTQADGQPGITQITGTGGVFSIPAEKLIVLTNEREGNNFAGVSILRPAYKHWYIKNNLYQISALAHERQGLGVVHITPPDVADEADRAKAIEAARNIRANEQSYIEVPAGWNIEWMDMKGHTTIDPDKDIQHHNRMIWTNILGAFMEMGSHKGSGGTQSSSQDQSKYLDLNLESVANNIAEILQSEVVRQLVDMNFTVGEDGYPQVKHSGLGETDITSITTAMANLTNANLLTPTADTEKVAREMLNLPVLDERYENDYENRPKLKPETGGLDPAKSMGMIGPDGKPVEIKPMADNGANNDNGGDGSNTDGGNADDITAAEIMKAAESALEASDKILKLYDRV